MENKNQEGVREKAMELVEKFRKTLSTYTMSKKHRLQYAKQCALICAQECIDGCGTLQKREYWQQIKKEIENL